MDVYPGSLCSNTIAKFGIADVHLPKNQKDGEAANPPEEVVHIKDNLSVYRFGAKELKVTAP